MQSLESLLAEHVAGAVETLFGQKIEISSVTLQRTNPQFEGDITLVVFPFTKLAGKGPEQTASAIGEYLQQHAPIVERFNVVKGFLNLVISDKFWSEQFQSISGNETFGLKSATPASPFVMVEYSSPNTNKPLHLGHVRNNLLGFSISEILKANGNRVMKVNLVNDRGIHICKSMIAWQRWGNGETPQSTGTKGDHLVGKYYVIYNTMETLEIEQISQRLKEISNELNIVGKSNETFNVIVKEDGLTDKEAFKNRLLTTEMSFRNSDGSYCIEDFPSEIQEKIIQFFIAIKNSCFAGIQDMLRKWEAGDLEVRALWEKMNSWVYSGFEESYKKLGVSFDKIYYESNTYLLGKEIIETGLKKGVLEKPGNAPGPVTLDLTADGLDKKVLLRSDGTSVYMTQDLGTALERYKEFPFDKHIYVVGNEQEYHFKVLKLALKKLGYAWAEGLYHLSYGMVELPDGKMKSREGTVVDADDLIAKMEKEARELAEEKGLIEGMEDAEKEKLAHMVGMAALKYFILKVDAKKKMLFNPKESIDLHGNTGPFIQYTHARIRSIWRKSELQTLPTASSPATLHPKEKELVKILYAFPASISEAANSYSPSALAAYVYDLAKTFNQFYDACPVLKEENAELKNFRIVLAVVVARTIKTAMGLLGIEVPEKM